ncbi:uncharacterized protein LOC127708324 [Mytilus californianus]|uniref:uncharacterized protein LOC127708324 n=1 Tax=Mytilus californianus TaxID=6549 RepID=UPI0022451A9F|nr:uncharacterized protein LOC127708324 [Mytilus californianus]
MTSGRKREIMSVHGDPEEKWEKRMVSIHIALYDQIIIEGSIKQIGSISLDDISLLEGPCIEDEEYNDSCLSINQQYKIEECATFHFQREGLNIMLHPSFTNSNNEEECINQENEIEWNLNKFCRDNYLYNNCNFNLESFISNYIDCFTFNKRISITYLCTESDKTLNDSAIGK